MQREIVEERLSPSGARPQSFPFDSWRRTEADGFDLIEWLFTAARYRRNSIWIDAGLAGNRRCIGATDVSVASICADYFVDHPLLRVADAERQRHLQVLNVLIERAAWLDARIIVLPVLDRGELGDERDEATFL